MRLAEESSESQSVYPRSLDLPGQVGLDHGTDRGHERGRHVSLDERLEPQHRRLGRYPEHEDRVRGLQRRRRERHLFTGPAGWGGPGVALSNRDSTFSPYGPRLPTFAYWATSPGVQVIPGDVNGDGLDDVTLSAPGWGSFPVAYATGGGEFGVNNVQVNNSSDPNLALFLTRAQSPNMRIIPGDFNGDGFGDFALTGSAGVNSLPVLYNGPSGPRSASNEPLADFPWWATDPNATAVSGDFNGDGRDDIALVNGGGWWSVPVAFSYGNGTLWISNEVPGTFRNGRSGRTRSRSSATSTATGSTTSPSSVPTALDRSRLPCPTATARARELVHRACASASAPP